jgi:hypothetical protein
LVSFVKSKLRVGKKAQAANGERHASFGVRLLSKSEVCAIANVTFPTIWSWMQRGTRVPTEWSHSL